MGDDPEFLALNLIPVVAKPVVAKSVLAKLLTKPLAKSVVRGIQSLLLLPHLMLGSTLTQVSIAAPSPEQTIGCDLFIVGGGLAGTAAAYEALLDGRTVCMTEITDWLGGQISSQGTSALDEAQRQRSLQFFPRGYNEFRQRIWRLYGEQNPGNCWVSTSCFIPRDGHRLLWEQLQAAARKGKGTLKWFPSTVVKDLQFSPDGKWITGAIAIQHRPAPGQPPLNTYPLSHLIEDIYQYRNSPRLHKTILNFVPATPNSSTPPWYVIEATETGELIGLAQLPHRLGLDPLSYREPSSPVRTADPYCTQGFTYTFAMERTAEPQPQSQPPTSATSDPAPPI